MYPPILTPHFLKNMDVLKKKDNLIKNQRSSLWKFVNKSITFDWSKHFPQQSNMHQNNNKLNENDISINIKRKKNLGYTLKLFFFQQISNMNIFVSKKINDMLN